MLLTCGAISIREARKADAQQLCAWWNDGRVMAHAGFPHGLGIDSAVVKALIAGDTDDMGRRLIIRYDDAPIGEMSYRNKGDGVAEIGIKICEESRQEQGIGTTCLTLLIHSLFMRGYRQIVLDTNLTNTRAQHVYEKLGFRKTRVVQDAFRDQLGRMQTAVEYALIPDWFTQGHCQEHQEKTETRS